MLITGLVGKKLLLAKVKFILDKYVMSSSIPILPIPTTTDVNRITSLSDAVLRNLQITQCYHELTAQILERTGMNANWCTFATWASKQAG